MCSCTYAPKRPCRHFLVEKARGASILGLLVGTLASPGLTRAMTHLRALVGAVLWMLWCCAMGAVLWLLCCGCCAVLCCAMPDCPCW